MFGVGQVDLYLLDLILVGSISILQKNKPKRRKVKQHSYKV